MSCWFVSFSAARSPFLMAAGHVRRAQTNLMKSSGLKAVPSFLPVADPFPPETPQNARAENQTVHADGRVSVLLCWDPPSEGDLLVHHYKVTWSTRGAAAGGPNWKESSRVVDGVRLPQCSSYLISIRGQPTHYFWLQIMQIFFCLTLTAGGYGEYILWEENPFQKNERL